MGLQTALFIDAGFLLASAGKQVAGTTYRDAIAVDFPALIEGLGALTRSARGAGDETHRVLWYDAAYNGIPTDEQKSIALLPDVKVRLGRIAYSGEQKGVDLRIALDLISTARAGIVKIAYLLSGDDDLTEAVEEAQSLGMKVVLVAPEMKEHRLGVANVAERLAMEADRILPLPLELLRESVSKAKELRTGQLPVLPVKATPPTAPTAPRAPEPDTAAVAAVPSNAGGGVKPAPPAVVRPEPVPDTSARVYYSTASSSEVSEKFKANLQEVSEVAESLATTLRLRLTPASFREILLSEPELPRDIDAALLRDCASRVGETTMTSQGLRHQARQEFWTAMRRLSVDLPA